MKDVHVIQSNEEIMLVNGHHVKLIIEDAKIRFAFTNLLSKSSINTLNEFILKEVNSKIEAGYVAKDLTVTLKSCVDDYNSLHCIMSTAYGSKRIEVYVLTSTNYDNTKELNQSIERYKTMCATAEIKSGEVEGVSFVNLYDIAYFKKLKKHAPFKYIGDSTIEHVSGETYHFDGCKLNKTPAEVGVGLYDILQPHKHAIGIFNKFGTTTWYSLEDFNASFIAE